MLRNETANDPVRMKAALNGLRMYQAAVRPENPLRGEIVDREGRVTLRSYGATGRPVIFGPSLINSAAVLDLTPGNSMMMGLTARGLKPMLLDWGNPGPEERDLDLGGHVQRYLLPLLERAPDAALAGYCLGGTIAIAASMLRPPPALLLIATPWDFSGFPSQTRNDLLQLWHAAEPTAEALGLMPAEILQQVFWQIDAARTVRKFEQFAEKDPASDEGLNYVAVEDWANDGPPMTLAASRDVMQRLQHDNIAAAGLWSVGGTTIDPSRLTMPILNIVSTTDRITPAATAWTGGERVALEEGHVGMVVGRRAATSLWPIAANWLLKA